MRTWSAESVLIRAYTTAAVAAQGLIDVFTHRPGYNSGAHPIPGCPNASDCREYGCAGNCSEASEADERFAGPEEASARWCPCGSETCGVCRQAAPQLALSDSELAAIRRLMTRFGSAL